MWDKKEGVLPVRTYVTANGAASSKALPAFHALSG